MIDAAIRLDGAQCAGPSHRLAHFLSASVDGIARQFCMTQDAEVCEELVDYLMASTQALWGFA